MSGNDLYAAAWRWHFYAGLLVIPFFLVLAITGMLMLLSPSIEPVLYRQLYEVTPAANRIPVQQQLDTVQRAYPHMNVVAFVPGAVDTQSNRFALMPARHGHSHGGHDGGGSVNVFVNPYTGAVLGELDPQTTLYSLANRIHGSLLLGQAGDYVIEIMAGFGVLLTTTGLFLWWPRGKRTWRSLLWPAGNGGRRAYWRGLHAGLGFWISGLLLFFLFSGLAWTSLWGGRILQGWGTLPPQKLEAPLSERKHGSLNRQGVHEVPWALEQAGMPLNPASANRANSGNNRPDVDNIIRLAGQAGLRSFRIFLPQNDTETWTVSSTTINGDIRDPRNDTTLYFDQNDGSLLAAARFSDYPLLGKAMAAGISLHQGGLGIFNLLVNLLFCVAVISMMIAAIAMWRARRPAHAMRLNPPAAPSSQRVWKQALLIMLALGLLFPLTGLTILGVLVTGGLFKFCLQSYKTKVQTS